MVKRAIIIGAGPAGLTAAYELLKRTDVKPIILEKSGDIGGISKTQVYKGNRMDMGPHRFFSKSDRVMNWWLTIMPLEDSSTYTISYQNRSRDISGAPNAANGQDRKTMLVIQRLTRIYFLRRLFSYPIRLSMDMLKTLGLMKSIRILVSYLWIKLFPRRPEKSLEDFIINKFGRELYLLFFKDYTEKVWGVACPDIPAEWGAQRIKGVSLSKALSQAIRSLYNKKTGDLAQKKTETSLIEQFLYPKYGPGSLWEEVARQVIEMGGEIHLNEDVRSIEQEDGRIAFVRTENSQTKIISSWEGYYFFSSMPVQELIAGMGSNVPPDVQEVAAGLQYRDFINVGILLKQMSSNGHRLDLKDNWIYIQERDVKVGRLMIYNNWGDGMIKDPENTWIGMEYFCNKTDDFWALTDNAIEQHAIMELEKLSLASTEDVLDITVRRMEKTYPAYFGTYNEFDKIRAYTDKCSNLFLVGRNGMHKYNNADHSMLTAMVAVDNIAAGVLSKDNIWAINTEQEYHEEKATPDSADKVPTTQNRRIWEKGLVGHIWSHPLNRAYCCIALTVYLIQFLVFKAHYPFANYMPDSYSYLEAASSNADVNMWPVAYSKFLRLMSVFTHSDKVLVFLQYFFIQISGLLLLFTFDYFLRTGKTVRNALFIILLLNPVPLYIANYISADALFIGLSLLWFNTLIWIIYQPRPWQILVHAFLLLACFTVRYNAIYYPVLTVIVYLSARKPLLWRLSGISVSAILILGSMQYTSHKMKEVSGKSQFSAFGGWQLANNALYMYEHIPASERKTPPQRFKELEMTVRQHMDTLKKVKLTKEDSVNSYFYLWSARGPLIQYMARAYKKDSVTPYFKRWASEGPLYADYAQFLIRSYPITFIKYFMFPNAIKWTMPPSEFLGTYNMGGDSVGLLAKDWFQYKSQKVAEHNKVKPIAFTEWYPIFSVLVNLLLLIHLVGLLVFGSLKNSNGPIIKLLALGISLWLLNAGFSIFASPIVLRYQFFPIVISLSLALFTGEIIYRKEAKLKTI